MPNGNLRRESPEQLALEQGSARIRERTGERQPVAIGGKELAELRGFVAPGMRAVGPSLEPARDRTAELEMVGGALHRGSKAARRAVVVPTLAQCGVFAAIEQRPL